MDAVSVSVTNIPGVAYGAAAALPIAQAGGGETSPLLTILTALLAGGVVTAVVNARQRRKSGEGPSAAARDLSEAAGRLSDTAEGLVDPLRRQNAELFGRIAELERKNAEKGEDVGRLSLLLAGAQGKLVEAQTVAANDRHHLEKTVALLQARVAQLEITLSDRDAELHSFRVARGDLPDRRSLPDRRDDPQS